MSRNQRTAMLVAAVVVLIIGFVVLRPSSDEGSTDGATTAVRTVAETTGTGTTQTTTTVQEAAPRPAAPVVVVRDGQPVGGVKKLQFKKGATIDFRVRSDTPGEIHFHGYDVHRDVPAGGGTVRFRLPAKFDGRFVVEIEATGTEIAQVEVSP